MTGNVDGAIDDRVTCAGQDPQMSLEALDLWARDLIRRAQCIVVSAEVGTRLGGRVRQVPAHGERHRLIRIRITLSELLTRLDR